MTQVDLGDRVGVVGPTTVSAVERMEKMGLIERRKSATDKRLSHIHLTEMGRGLKDELVHYAKEVADEGLANLDKAERDQFHKMLLRVHAALAASGD